MSTLSIMINGRDYQVACDDGQEQHVKMLANSIDDRVRGLATRMGQTGDNMLLVLASLMMADELHDISREVSELQKQINQTTESLESGRMVQMEKAIASTIHDIAARIEKIAETIEKT